MAIIDFVRVDFRLIHGQVITKWRKVHPVDKIIIIDDILSKDEFMQKIYENAAPPGMKVKIYDADKAVKLWNKNQFREGLVMLLFRDVAMCHETIAKGLPISRIQLGGAPKKDGKKSIITTVSLTEEEMRLCEELNQKGVEIVAQSIPEEHEVDFKEMKRRFYS